MQAVEIESYVEPLLTSAEAAEILRINSQVLERWARRREIPALKVGWLWRFRASALDGWITQKLESKTSQPCCSF